MSRRTLWTLAGVVAVLGLLALGRWWFLQTHHKVDQTLYLPPQGEARYNPLYALKQTLKADGLVVSSRQRLDLGLHALQPGDTLLLFGDPQAILPSESRRLLAWVEAGGHLLVRTPIAGRGNDDSLVPLLQTIGIEPLPVEEYPPMCVGLQVAGEDRHSEFCSGRRFHLIDQEPVLSWGDLLDGYAYARMRHGRGTVDVLADFDFIENAGTGGSGRLFDLQTAPSGGLRDGPHRALARNLLAPNYGKGTMHLIYAARMPSLWRTVITHGWMAWLPLLGLLLAWLWLRQQRFGPLLPAQPTARRSLLEHVRASGDHLFRYGRGVLLYTAARQAFLLRLRRRDPVAAALAGEAQVAAIAERMQLPVERVRRALQTPGSHDRAGFRDRISTLIQMRNQL